MSNFLQLTEFENGKENDSNGILNNQTITLEFTLLDGKIGKKPISTSLGLKVFFGVLLIILETLGNYLLFCMVWYEKFGMDSKKRTITNQLLTRMLLAHILFNIFFMPLYFVGILIPPSEYFKELYDYLKSVHFKKPVMQSSFPSKSVIKFVVVILKIELVYRRMSYEPIKK